MSVKNKFKKALYIRGHFCHCAVIHAMGARRQNPGHLYTSPAHAFAETSRWDSSSCTVRVCVTVSFRILFLHLQRRKPIFHSPPLTPIYSLFSTCLRRNVSTDAAIGCRAFLEEEAVRRMQKRAHKTSVLIGRQSCCSVAFFLS